MNSTDLKKMKNELQELLSKINHDHELEAFRVEHLSRQGTVTELMKQMKTMSVEDKRTMGPLLNQFKQEMQQLFDQKKELLFQDKIRAEQERQQWFDVSLSRPKESGSLHPYTQITEQIESIFSSMGFRVADGTELETSFFNFEALNVPKDHPAREESDTFWIDQEHLLRTQTSTVQIHTMQNEKPPIAIIAPGRALRNEATDASHDYMFMQVEGLYIDKNVSVSNLLATVKTFLRELFGQEIKIRVRPGYFPFVEPGLEIDASCPFCKTGCSVCKKTGWIELMGAGLVHPNVLRHGGIDPDEYSGFAFGFGLTRLTMLKYHISDIRLLHSGNISFLKQF